jgi:ABC-type lipoprotein export system ATPase subunit
MSNSNIIQLTKVRRTFTASRREVKALNDIDLSVRSGEFVVIHGPSGCGKSTLLFTLGGMLRPSGGSVAFLGRELYDLSAKERSLIRKHEIGFVFQMFHLIPYLNVRENILLAAARAREESSVKRADALIERLSLSHRAHHKPAELSIGERQRAAVARALINEPKVILADEPTGNLDAGNAERLLEDLSAYHREGGTVLVVSHGTMADRYASRQLQMSLGQILEGSEAQKIE